CPPSGTVPSPRRNRAASSSRLPGTPSPHSADLPRNKPSFIERAVGAPRAPLERASGRPLASAYGVLFNSSGAARSEGGVALGLGAVRGRGRGPSCSYRPACCFSGGALKTIVREPWWDETELCACAFGNVAVELCLSARPSIGLVTLALSGHEFIP